jgi:Mce-associated membrane protein
LPSSNPGRPQQHVRRPKVAGLRRPSPSPRPKQDDPKQDETSETTQGAEQTETFEAVQSAETVEAPEWVESAPGAEPTEPVETQESVDRPGLTPASGPSPRAKSRDEGVPKPSDFDEAEAALTEPAPKDRKSGRSSFVIAGALFGLALVLAGFAVWFKIEDNKLSAATDNTALLDVARTSQVNQAATSAAETLFSYDYKDIAKTQNAAKDLLLNDEVRAKYDSLMGEVERLAPQQKIVVTVKASRSAVIMLNGDRAKVMVFVDQTATRTDQNQTSSGSAQLWLNMQYSGGKWKVSSLNTYNSENPATATPSTTPAPSTSQAPASSTQAPASSSKAPASTTR